MTTRNFKTVAFEGDPEIMRMIDAHCKIEGISRSLFIRKATAEKILRITSLPRPDRRAKIVPVIEIEA